MLGNYFSIYIPKTVIRYIIYYGNRTLLWWWRINMFIILRLFIYKQSVSPLIITNNSGKVCRVESSTLHYTEKKKKRRKEKRKEEKEMKITFR